MSQQQGKLRHQNFDGNVSVQLSQPLYLPSVPFVLNQDLFTIKGFYI